MPRGSRGTSRGTNKETLQKPKPKPKPTTRRSSTTSRVTPKPKTRNLTSKEKEIKKIKAEEDEINNIKAAENLAITHAVNQAPIVADEINQIVQDAYIKHMTTTTATTTTLQRQSTLHQDQKEAPSCISFATSRTMVNIIFPENTFYYLTPDNRLAMMQKIIQYLNVPTNSEINFDGKLIPEFLNILVSELKHRMPISNIGIFGTTVQGDLPETAVPILNELLDSQPITGSDNQCTSPLWTGAGNCVYFNNYIVVYVILPKKSSDYLYGLRYNSTDKMKYQLELIALSKQSYDITYDEVRGLYSTRFHSEKKKMATVGHALVIKGYRRDPATTLITHLLVRNSWGDCEDPIIGGYWVPIEFFNKNTYAAFRFVSMN